jgi:hypothetical protein
VIRRAFSGFFQQRLWKALQHALLESGFPEMPPRKPANGSGTGSLVTGAGMVLFYPEEDG